MLLTSAYTLDDIDSARRRLTDRHGGYLTHERILVSASGWVRVIGTIRDHNYPDAEDAYRIDVLTRQPDMLDQIRMDDACRHSECLPCETMRDMAQPHATEDV